MLGIPVLMQTVDCQNGTFSVTVQLTPNTTNRFDVCLVPGSCGTGGCAHVAIDQVSATLTPSATPTVTPTPVATVCTGNCNGDGEVTIDELLVLVNVALGNAQASACLRGVPSGAKVDIALIIRAVNNALNGCSKPV